MTDAAAAATTGAAVTTITISTISTGWLCYHHKQLSLPRAVWGCTSSKGREIDNRIRDILNSDTFCLPQSGNMKVAYRPGIKDRGPQETEETGTYELKLKWAF